MLKKENRLKLVRLINPKVFSSSDFTLKTVNNGLDINRFAFVISKKVDRRAVARNSLRRKFSSIIEELSGNIRIGIDFVFYPKSRSLISDRESLLLEIKEILSKGKLIND